MTGAVVSRRGRFAQTLEVDGYASDRRRCRVRYYWRGVRVPWIMWAIFARGPER